MPLKLGPISQEIEQLVAGFTDEENLRRYQDARRLLPTVPAEALRRKIQGREVRVPWLVGIPVDSLDRQFPAPQPPQDFSVAAADGSSINPDRHTPLRYYLFNTSRVLLSYGKQPQADIESSGKLYYQDQDLYLGMGRRSKPIEGALLDVKRTIQELRALWEVASQARWPTVALFDGSLILWGIQNEERETQQEILGEFLALLEEFRQARIPVAGYISFPGSHDVANSLRVWLCERPDFRCEECSCARRDLSISLIRIPDQEVFRDLAPGERSPIFNSQSEVLRRYSEHRVQFFYLHTSGEIARLEAPRWVMEDKELCNLLHAVVYDQCRRSAAWPPYPPALQEAHEEALITAQEREIVDGLIQESLGQRGWGYLRSAKLQSKRVRPV